jgi:hypothetical protein
LYATCSDHERLNTCLTKSFLFNFITIMPPNKEQKRQLLHRYFQSDNVPSVVEENFFSYTQVTSFT